MALTGMDIEAVEAIANELKSHASRIESLTNSIDGVVRTLPGLWRGNDANRFINDWWPEHRAALVAARDHVDGLGQSALNNASEQRGVSDSVGGGTSAGAGIAPASTVAAGSGGSTATSGDIGSGSAGALSTVGDRDALQSAYSSQAITRADGWDQNGKAPGQCTSWAAYRRLELGLSSPWGDGGQMASQAGGTNSTAPTLGALVSDTSGAYGHVMIVEEILPTDPPSFRVSEMNYAGGVGEVKNDRIWTAQADGTWRSGRQVSDLIIAP